MPRGRQSGTFEVVCKECRNESLWSAVRFLTPIPCPLEQHCLLKHSFRMFTFPFHMTFSASLCLCFLPQPLGAHVCLMVEACIKHDSNKRHKSGRLIEIRFSGNVAFCVGLCVCVLVLSRSGPPPPPSFFANTLSALN